MNAYLASVIENVKKKHGNEPEFVQTVEEVLTSLDPVISAHPEYEAVDLLGRLVEPERMFTFRKVFCFIYRLRRGTAALIKIHQCLCPIIHTVFHFSVVVTLVCKNFDGISRKRYPVKAFFCLLIR